jgi:hypothetical protein
MSGTVWIGFFVLLGAIILEIFAPSRLTEGFQILMPVIDKPPTILTEQYLRRGDVSPGLEQQGYIQDRRYFNGYANVQRIGVKNDFCRVVTPGAEEDAFFACALAGTSTTSPYEFRSRTVGKGLVLGRDDYMRDIYKDGAEAYCRIIKDVDGLYKPLCIRPLIDKFSDRDELDIDPPEEIKTLVDFYSGCKMWLRFRDDMLDYVKTAIVQSAGGITIDHTPNPAVTRGLHFNGVDQFLRIGDTNELSLGNKVNMRTVRAFSVWAYFDEFTNNAHIFDFGDGAGMNNVFLGILGKGEGGDVAAELRPGPKCQETTVPDVPTGAQWCPELRPQDLLQKSRGNVDEYTCMGPEMYPKKEEPIQTRPLEEETGPATRATLLYEVWDRKLRKVQIKVNRVIPLKQWVHIVVTAKTNDAMRPDIHVYVNGNLVHVKEEGFLPQAKVTSNNYLGKSNWTNASSEYELRDELFSGSLFDFRMYETPLGETKIKRILQWGTRKLGLDNSFESVV